jgi:hypothetical protein
MNATALQRQAALAGAALLAMLLVVVLDRPGDMPTVVETPPPVSAATWQDAQIGIASGRLIGACGDDQGADVRGIVHPVLPCGVKLVLSAHGRTIRSEVVAEGPVATGREFAQTEAVAQDQRVGERDRIRWRLAG